MAAELTPIVYWGQKNDHISLKVDIRDASEERIDLTEYSLEFHALAKGAQGHNQYGFQIDFYLPVNTEESRMRLLDRAVEFHIKKQGEEVWPRLTEKQLRLPWLKIDFDKFAFEDEEEENIEGLTEEEAQKEVLRKLEEDLLKDTEKPPDFSITYLFLYNMFQFVGFFYVLVALLYNYIRYGAEVKYKAFEVVGTQLMVCQAFALLEVVHPLIGLVKTGVISPLMQVAGRNFMLFVLILQEPRLQDAPAVFYLFVVWSAIEIIRYPFYMLSSIGVDIKIVTWLRYNAWIPLYPLGLLFEGTVIIMAIPLFEEVQRFTLVLPNSSNFSFYFPWFLHAYLLVLAIEEIMLDITCESSAQQTNHIWLEIIKPYVYPKEEEIRDSAREVRIIFRVKQSHSE